MQHEELAIAEWIARFPLAAARAQGPEIEPEFISGPRSIALLEQLRAEAFGPETIGDRVPTDVFIWSLTDPGQRHRTQIGGSPYRSRNKPWPLDAIGQPRQFLAQLCFADSHDLFPMTLPGDVLLIFSAVEEWQRGAFDLAWGQPEMLLFEWGHLGETELIEAAEAPQAKMPLLPCYGARYRTWDVAGEEPPDASQQDSEARRTALARWDCAVVEGTKIGGIAPRLFDQDVVHLGLEEPFPPGHFLDTIATVGADTSEPYAFLDMPEAIDFRDLSATEAWQSNQHALLMIADAGLLNFFLDDTGAVRWTGRCAT
jgi:hypothetical protein